MYVAAVFISSDFLASFKLPSSSKAPPSFKSRDLFSTKVVGFDDKLMCRVNQRYLLLSAHPEDIEVLEETRFSSETRDPPFQLLCIHSVFYMIVYLNCSRSPYSSYMTVFRL